MRACDELVGSPQYQVRRFQVQAPTKVAAINWLLTMLGSMMSFWMVSATLSGKTRNATKLKNAAQSTAARGLSTRVETTVATELAASWRPLRKSKVSASRMSSHTVKDKCVNGKWPKFTLSKKC